MRIRDHAPSEDSMFGVSKGKAGLGQTESRWLRLPCLFFRALVSEELSDTEGKEHVGNEVQHLFLGLVPQDERIPTFD